jgi:hypothetical protein
MNYTIKVISLSCFQTSETNGDEIYLVYNNKKVWPTNKKYEEFTPNSTRSMSLIIDDVQLNDRIALELWEEDVLFDDKLGTFEFLVDAKGYGFNTDLKKTDPDSIYKYTLAWESTIE